MSEKVKYMESRKRWSSVANEKQYLYNVKIKQLAIEDVRKELEDYFGSRSLVPEKIEEAIKIGEKEIDVRIKMIKIKIGCYISTIQYGRVHGNEQGMTS